MDESTPWLPIEWQHPTRAELGTGHHLRPVRESDVELELAAVLGSRARLWSVYGAVWGWPPDGMTLEQERVDLARHEAETEAHESFNYGLFDLDETVLLGCVYIDPPARTGADADISWWVVDDLVGTETAAALDAFVPRWIAADWPLRAPRYLGRDVAWTDWLALPELR